MSDIAASNGKIGPAEVAQRMQAVVEGTNPPDPLATKPELGASLRQALRNAKD
jgi:hypothetical protein